MTVIVYDVNGKLVRRLHEGYIDSGTQLFRWNGENDAGTLLPSGIYFCRLQTQSGEIYVKAVLTR